MLDKNSYNLVRCKITGFACGAEGEYSGIWESSERIEMSNEKWKRTTPLNAYLTLRLTKHLPDYLSCGGHYCFSAKAYELLVPTLRFWSKLQWVKVRALDPLWLKTGTQDGYCVADYWWPKCDWTGLETALDLDHAEYIAYPPHPVLRPPGTIVTKEVTHWVLDSRIIGDLDWFYGPHINWFASPRARSLIEDDKLTGFKFTPIDVWQYDN